MKTLSALIFSLLLGSGMALAQDVPPTFSSVDTNGDGQISASELAAAGLPFTMDQADTNGDGVLSREEYQQAIQNLTR